MSEISSSELFRARKGLQDPAATAGGHNTRCCLDRLCPHHSITPTATGRVMKRRVGGCCYLEELPKLRVATACEGSEPATLPAQASWNGQRLSSPSTASQGKHLASVCNTISLELCLLLNTEMVPARNMEVTGRERRYGACRTGASPRRHALRTRSTGW